MSRAGWQLGAWYVAVCLAGVAVFAILFAMTGATGPAALAGFATGLLLLLFARLQEPGTPDGYS